MCWKSHRGGCSSQRRCNANLAAVEEFVYGHPGFEFLASESAIRSNTSVCLKLDLSAGQLKCVLLGKCCGLFRDANILLLI